MPPPAAPILRRRSSPTNGSSVTARWETGPPPAMPMRSPAATPFTSPSSPAWAGAAGGYFPRGLRGPNARRTDDARQMGLRRRLARGRAARREDPLDWGRAPRRAQSPRQPRPLLLRRGGRRRPVARRRDAAADL